MNIARIWAVFALVTAVIVLMGQTPDPTGHLDLERRISTIEQKLNAVEEYELEMKKADLRVRTAKLELELEGIRNLLTWILGLAGTTVMTIIVKAYLDNKNFQRLRATQHRTVNYLTGVLGTQKLDD